MIPEQLWSLTKEGKLINKLNRTEVWEYQDKVWNMRDGYIQDQNSSNVIALMDDVKASGTRVILTTKINTSDSATWTKGSVYDQWFHLKPEGFDLFLTAEGNNMTTVTGNDYRVSQHRLLFLF